MRFLSIKDVTARTSLSRSTILRQVKDNRFPAPLKILGGTRVVFLEAEVTGWMADQAGMAVAA
jgi:predicted DNA-binding transcriptional regulator AlpA